MAVAAVKLVPAQCGLNIPLLDGGIKVEEVDPRVADGLEGRLCTLLS